MSKKTLYVKDEDEKLWVTAESLSEISLSQLITELLRKEVRRQQIKKQTISSQETQRFVFPIRRPDNYGNKTIAFNGYRYLIGEAVKDSNGKERIYSVILTAKYQLFCTWLYPYAEVYECYNIYSSFDEMVESGEVPPEILHEVSLSLGEDYVEFLDI